MSQSKPAPLSRAGYALTALAAMGGAAVLLLHYPVAREAAMAAWAVWFVVLLWRPTLWLVALPALLPIAGLAPWTGWLGVEENDLLVLGAAAAAHLRLALAGLEVQAGKTSRSSRRHAYGATLLIVLFAASTAISAWRGVMDAGGPDFGWYQGYDEALNSLRIAKSFFLALLMFPLLRQAMRTEPEANARRLATGLTLGLCGAALATVWERVAFTGLLNFSTDYRTTALFWEMHVGGAALDGFLLLTLPFALWGLHHARGKAGLAAAAVAIALAAYAALTTFSRGVYLAAAVALPVLFWLRHRAKPDDGGGATGWSGLRWGVAMLFVAVATVLVFPGSGYRGVLAMLGCLVALMAVGSSARALRPTALLAALAAGLVLGLGAAFAAEYISKGPYLVYALLFCLAVAAAVAGFAAVAVAAFAWLTVAAAHVAVFWGGPEAGQAAAVSVAMLVLLIWQARAGAALWPAEWRWRASMAAVATAIVATIAVFSGGMYMGNRFTTSGHDFAGRVEHWRQALGTFASAGDWLFGKGTGRFPATYFFAAPKGEFPGTYQLKQEGGNQYLAMTGGRHINGFGEVFRASQRVTVVPGENYTLAFRARTDKITQIHLEICEKHLLYNAACTIHAEVLNPTQAGPDGWQAVKVGMAAMQAGGGDWYAPRLVAFSVAVETRGGKVDFDDFALSGAGGRPLLANGDFDEGLARWFTSSDRHHMPWHIKSMFMNILFDQGLFGFTLFVLMLGVALWRVARGGAARHVLAPYLGASIVGVIVVGLFDSLLDVPRLAFLFHLLVMLCLVLENPRLRTHSTSDHAKHT